VVCCPHPAQITLVPCDALRLVAAAATAAARLFVLLGLPARFAALRRRITTLAEELLILRSKRECLPAIAAHELLIFSHISLSSMLQCVLRSKYHSNFAVCSVARDRGRPIRSKVR
jgi:hypothetical protein